MTEATPRNPVDRVICALVRRLSLQEFRRLKEEVLAASEEQVSDPEQKNTESKTAQEED